MGKSIEWDRARTSAVRGRPLSMDRESTSRDTAAGPNLGTLIGIDRRCRLCVGARKNE